MTSREPDPPVSASKRYGKVAFDGQGARRKGMLPRIAAEPDEDAALIEAAQAGDTEATDALLRRHYDRIYAVCRRVTGDDADGADAAQEALMALVRGLPSFDGRSRFTTWSYRVAVNASLDELRRRKRRPLLQVAPEPAAGADPSEAVGARLDVDRALRTLPAEFRVAVVLRDLCGLDYAEIADVLGVPPGTVRSRIARGRAALVPILASPTEWAEQ
jgi:RNA polymerase sigma-70 factor (ECF subfamily)